MKINFVPKSINQSYSDLKDAKREEKIYLIKKVFEEIIVFMGKILLLEYAQSNSSKTKINFELFEYIYDLKISCWIKIIHTIFPELPKNESSIILQPIKNFYENYGNSNSLLNIFKFYSLFSSQNNLIADSDIHEAQKQIYFFIKNLLFFKKELTYENKNNKYFVIYNDKRFEVSPFFVIEERNSRLNLEYNEVSELLDYFEYYLQEEFQKYRKQKRGNINFEQHKKKFQENYIQIPWVKTELIKTLQDSFEMLEKLNFNNLVVIKGYPASGKTALASNLENIVPKEICNFVFTYFISFESLTNKIGTFINWTLNKLKNNKILHNDSFGIKYKVVIAIDNLQHLDTSGYQQFIEQLKKPPFNQIVFVLFQRLYENYHIHCLKSITLDYKDNISFFKTFTYKYKNSLIEYYTSDSALGWKILSVLAKEVNKYIGIVELAEQLQCFTPEVSKEISKLKPLLSIKIIAKEKKYKLFDPILKDLLCYSNEKG